MPIEKSELQKHIEAQTGGDARPANLTVHPGTLEQFGAALCDSGASGVYSAARQALVTVGTEITNMIAAEQAVRAPHVGQRKELSDKPGVNVVMTINPELRPAFETGLAASHARVDAALQKASDAAVATVNAVNQELEIKLRNPSADRVSVATADSEIRSIVRAHESEEKRAMTISQFIQSGDLVAAAACLNCSPVAIGLPKAKVQELRELAARTFCGPLVAKREAAKGTLEHLQRAGIEFLTAHKKITPPADKQLAAKQRASATATLEALHTGKNPFAKAA